MPRTLLALVFVLSACGTPLPPRDEPPPDAAGAPDASAAPDAPVPPEMHGAPREVVTGAGRISGGAFTVDVEIGHPLDQAPSAGGDFAIDGAATIK